MLSESSPSKKSPTGAFVPFLVAFLLFWALRATVLYRIDEAVPAGDWRAVYSNAIKFLVWVVPAFAFAMWAARENPFSYLGLSIAPSPRQWALCLSAITIFLAIVATVDTTVGGKTFNGAALTFSITVSGIGFYLVSPFLEEILFRGLILNEFGRRQSPWAANLSTSLIFLGVHLPHWLWHDGFSTGLVANSVGVFLFSLLAGWCCRQGGSLWPPVIAHIANNTLASLLVVAKARGVG